MALEYIQGIQQHVDNNETIKLLRGALADELIAVHNYWTQAKVIQGVYREEIIKELIQHREEEQGHANMLMDRILQLGGNPEIRPIDWDRLTKCRYEPAVSWDQRNILEQAIGSEKCATEHYSNIAEFVRNKDITTYDIVMKIIEDEYEHIRDLGKLKDMIYNNPNDKKD
jgi:bacterioferritin